MEPEKIKLPEEPITEHKNAIPTNYKIHLEKEQQDTPGEIVPPCKAATDSIKTNKQQDNLSAKDAAAE